MARMVRKQLYIYPEQEKFLKEVAHELNISQAELLRRTIAKGSIPVGPSSLAKMPSAEEGAGPLDSEAWEAERAFIEDRANIAATGGQRVWSREELHDEGLPGRH